MKPTVPSLVFEATTDCNLRCLHCYNEYKRPGHDTEPLNDYGTARATLARLYKRADVQHISMSGGEPLMAQRFAELVLLCRMKGSSVNVISNGTFGTADDYATLVDLGVELFEFPILAADPDVHDELTGVPGSFDRTRQSVETVMELGGKVVAAVVLTRLNAPLIEPTLQLLGTLGVRSVMLNRFNPGGRGLVHRQRLELDIDALQHAFHTADGCGTNLSLTSNVCTPRCLLDPKDYRHIRFSTCSLDPARRPLALDARGNIRFCNHSPVVAGNIHRQSVAEILASSMFEEWERIPEYCADCEHWGRCIGGCRAATEQLGRTLDHPDPLLEPAL